MSLVVIAATRVGAQNPAAIEHHLRYGVRLAGQADVDLDLLDRMRALASGAGPNRRVLTPAIACRKHF